ncbi:transglutaminase-like cysteine peptidase [Sphingopyxis sp. H115]|uniref:transglutaminase-like cysteine peptidase n=1 Tax=Sphingopyxis sp. H115 TaxID=1759073 RepID=UPI0007361EA8|nr:transglutaminase-like cysteine peptidase [Sphingopyxis sp. H115]KTE16716.1 hypothetical protein ATE71_06125 [Sphingopyxis sp. H115]
MFARFRLSAFISVAALGLATCTLAMPATAHAVEGPAAKMANAKLAIGSACQARVALPPPSAEFADAREGGSQAPSALDRIRMSQERATPAVDVAPAGGDPAAVRPIAADASRLFQSDRPVTASARIDCGAPAPLRAALALDEDSELGTLAIPVETTRFDDRWTRVRRAPAARLMRAELDRAAVSRGLGEAATLERVNQWVNRRIAYIGDEGNYRQRDFWATAAETVARGSGDCEDFAILKMHMLRAAGIDDDRMKLVLLRDLAINADHAFLMVRSEAGWVVLDNMTDRIYDGRQANGVRPIMSFSGDRRWIHGYRDAVATKASMVALGSPPATAGGGRSFKTDAVHAEGIKLASAPVSIGIDLSRLFVGAFTRGAR